MGFYTEHILPRLVHLTLRSREVGHLRARALAGLSGTVLEVGFGSGLNLEHFPPEVDRLFAIEPAKVAREMARDAIRRAPFPVELIGETAESIPLPDDSVDAAVTTFTLCTIPDVDRALREMRRVLRPGGTLRFLEHGRAEEESVARWQDRLTPVQKRLAGGCHLNRRIDRLVRGAGFDVEALDTFYIRGPKVGTWLYAGRAS
jgi:ubiquinone/menaquinone biosynthesis C-methylase UbiE